MRSSCRFLSKRGTSTSIATTTTSNQKKNHHRLGRIAATASILLLSSASSLVPVSSYYGKAHHFHSTTTISLWTMTSSSNNHNNHKLEAPAAERNKEPIYDILKSQVLPLAGIDSIITNDDQASSSSVRLVEVGGGAGVHLNHFCRRLDEDLSSADSNNFRLEYQSCDMEERYRNSIQWYIDKELKDLNLKYVTALPPLPLTLNENGVVEPETQAILYQTAPQTRIMLCFNVIHISPWQATLGLMKLAGEVLQPGGVLFCYGPYLVNGTGVESNLNFDQSLRQRDPSWGIRNLEDVIAVAEANGLSLEDRAPIEMPANNLSLLFRKV